MAILHRAGVPLLTATETHAGSGVWGFAVHDELAALVAAALVAAGLTPAVALRAATLEPARAMGMQDSLGMVAPGMLADLVLLDADPLMDIAHSTRIRAVPSNGRLHDRSSLDRLLAAARGGFRSTSAREQAIRSYIAATDADPKPFVWPRTAAEVRESVARYRRRTTSSHH